MAENMLINKVVILKGVYSLCSFIYVIISVASEIVFSPFVIIHCSQNSIFHIFRIRNSFKLHFRRHEGSTRNCFHPNIVERDSPSRLPRLHTPGDPILLPVQLPW